MKQIGVILSGCGVFDGSEVYETVLTLLAIERAGAKAICYAPDKPQYHVINHLTGAESSESRNILVESSRIVRGEITSLEQMDVTKLDAVIIPGGFGVAKNLSDFVTAGDKLTPDTELKNKIRQIHHAGKPIGFICIAPALIPHLLEKTVKLTIGNDPETITVLESMGANHVICPVDEVVIDKQNKIVTTPAWMLAKTICESESGINKLVQSVVEMSNG